jgi:MFS family permease
VTAFSSIAALLLSVLMLIGGNSLVGIVTPLRARIEGFPDLTVGLLGSVYFAGMLAGTLAAPAIIRRGGHIRAYAAFVALAVVSVILMPVMLSQWAWLSCRALIGFVFAGLYAVIEAWINAKATNANRGALYALYQIANFAASASGQLALKPLGAGGFSPFAVAGALLALAIVPMAMTSVDPPAQPRSVRPRLIWLVRMAPVACFSGRRRGERRSVRARTGFCRRDRHGGDKRAVIHLFDRVGIGLGVLPIAAISDRVDRRLVIAAVMIAGAACEVALSRLTAPGAWLLVLGFLVGLTTYSLYTLAVSLANDHGDPHDLIFISVGLLFIYCVAAIAAPALASVLMKDFGPRMLFVQNAYVHTAVAALALWRLLAEPRRSRTRPV